ncbi:6130_t:CDS:2, partial [Racocetra persica]
TEFEFRKGKKSWWINVKPSVELLSKWGYADNEPIEEEMNIQGEDLPKKSIPEGEDPPKGKKNIPKERYFGGYFSGEVTPKEIEISTTPRKQMGDYTIDYDWSILS